MQEPIKHSLQEGTEDEFLLDEEYVAFLEGKCYDVHKSKARYKNGLFVDHVRAVFDESGKLISVAPPPFGFVDENLQLVPKKIMFYYENLARKYRISRENCFQI